MTSPLEMIDAYFEGVITDEQFQMLVLWLHEDPMHARIFATWSQLECQIYEHLKDKDLYACILDEAISEHEHENDGLGDPSVMDRGVLQALLAIEQSPENDVIVDISEKLEDRRRKEKARLSQEKKRIDSLKCKYESHVKPVHHYVIPKPLFYGSIAAVVAIVALIVWPMLPDVSPSNVEDTAGVAVSTQEPAVFARIVSLSDVEWRDGKASFDVDAPLAVNDALELKAGKVQLRFENTAEVTITGPARVEILAKDRMRLIGGSIAGRCEGEARGFTVETVNGRIVDLGTAFDVAVDDDQVCDVRVHEGLVEAALIDDTGSVMRSMNLSHDRAVRLNLSRRTMSYLPFDNTPIIGTRDVVTLASDAGRGGYEMFPNFCRLADGRIMMTFSAGYGMVSYPSDRYPNGAALMYRMSDDEGLNWSPAMLLIDTPDDDHVPAVTQLASGELLCVCSVSGKGTYIVTSMDNGKTWTEPRPLAEAPYHATAPIRELSNGRLIVPISHATFGDEIDMAVVYSDDRGVTWSQPVILPGGGIFDYLRTRGDLFETSEGRLFLYVQGGHGREMSVLMSPDFGETWRISPSVKLVAGTPAVCRLRDGNVVMVHREDANGSQRRTMLTVSRDEGKTWSTPVPVDVPGGGYPTVLELKDGSVIVGYMDRTHGADIYAKRFRITDSGIEPLKL